MQKSNLPFWAAFAVVVLLVMSAFFSRPKTGKLAGSPDVSAAFPSPPAATAYTAADDKPSLSRFDAWLKRYEVASPSERPSLLGEGLTLAKERMKEMEELLVSDPAMALARSIPRGRRAGLPVELLPFLETPIDATGMLGLAIACGHTPDEHVALGIDERAANDGLVPSHGTWRDAVFGESTYRAHVFGRRLRQKTLENVPLHGMALSGRMAVAEAPSRRVEPGEPAYRVDAIVVQSGSRWFSFATEAEAAAFESSLTAAEASADGPFVRYDFPDR